MPCCALAAFILGQILIGLDGIKRFFGIAVSAAPDNPATQWRLGSVTTPRRSSPGWDFDGPPPWRYSRSLSSRAAPMVCTLISDMVTIPILLTSSSARDRFSGEQLWPLQLMKSSSSSSPAMR